MVALEHRGEVSLLDTLILLIPPALSQGLHFVRAWPKQELVPTEHFRVLLQIHLVWSIILLVICHGEERLLMVLQQLLMLLVHQQELARVKRELVVMELSQEVIRVKLAMLDVRERLGEVWPLDIQIRLIQVLRLLEVVRAFLKQERALPVQ